MTPDDRLKPRFEPPPWEAEAFERLHREQAKELAAEELERALQALRQESGGQASSAAETMQDTPLPVVGLAQDEVALTYRSAGGEISRVPEAHIEAMLAALKAEEAPAAKAGLTLIYSTVAFLATMGTFVVIAAFVLFAKTKPAGGSASVLTSLASMVMLLTGGGLMAGAVVLFRKHQE
ncbi:MAG: hypothetical protein RBS17_03505 [Coriobacteriia bacterium]|nr:hypothetical protein [Coriobacteriia bacterium]